MKQAENATILPGMSGRARASKLKEASLSSGVVVPETALRPLEAGGDQMAVWVIDETSNTVALTPVEVGQILSVGIEVTDGLSDGDWVVTAGTHSLNADQEVRILASEPGERQ